MLPSAGRVMTTGSVVITGTTPSAGLAASMAAPLASTLAPSVASGASPSPVVAPAISRPSSATGTVGGRNPVIFPSYMTAIRSASA